MCALLLVHCANIVRQTKWKGERQKNLIPRLFRVLYLYVYTKHSGCPAAPSRLMKLGYIFFNWFVFNSKLR